MNILLAILAILLTFNILSFVKWRILCHTQGRGVSGMWKVPFRMVYCENAFSWIGETFYCLVWLKIKPHASTLPKIAALILSLSIFSAGCAAIDSALSSSTALNASAGTLLNQFDSGNTKLNTDALAGLYAAELIYTKYKGLTIPQSSIDTGIDKVSEALQQYNTGGIVTDANVETLKKVISALGGTP